MTTAERNAPGMRRVRLLVWALYVSTPLEIDIEEWVERAAARRCKLTWEQYCAFKLKYPEIWKKAENRRQIAKATGRRIPQPAQLRKYRQQTAKQRRLIQKPRPRFYEWAGRKLLRARGYKRRWLRQRATDRLFSRLIGK